MKRSTHTVSFFLTLVLSITVILFMATPISASSIDDKITHIQKAYDGIGDITGRFVQKSVLKDLKKTETFKGVFYIKRPMKMKWNYEGDSAPAVLINNNIITIYQKKEKQAFQGAFDRDTYGQAPIALLSGFGNIREEFTASESKGKLVLTPRKAMGGIASIEIELSESGFPIKSFTVIDVYSNKIEMTLVGVKTNTGLADALFDLSLPKDTTIFRQNP